MSYIEEIQAILNKYPEIRRIKIEVPELIMERNVQIHTIAKPEIKPINTGFEVTEVRLETLPEVKKPTTQKKLEDANALKATMAALTLPRV